MEKIFVTRPTLPPFEEYVDEIRGIWDSHILTNMGPKHQKLERELENYLKVENAILFTNGHSALELLLSAYSFPPGSEVITTPYTFASTTHAIVRNGLVPVFCDINEDDCTIDADKIETLITDKTVAILPVHVYGNICDVDKLDKISKAHDLKLVYDSAHAFGIEYKRRGIGSFGDASMFSFHATKVFNTIEGGLISCKDKNTVNRLIDLKNFGIRNEERVIVEGSNAKLNEFCAAMGICNLKHIEKTIENRRIVYERYVRQLIGVKGIELIYPRIPATKNFAYFPIKIKEDYGISRDGLYDLLKTKGIYARKYFYPITNEFECYIGKYTKGKTPIAHKISSEILTLPMYENLDLEYVDKICSIIRQTNRIV